VRLSLILAAISVVAPALFAQSPALPACQGDLAIVRVSTIKPGAMEGFMAAVAAHKAWYRDHGFKDNVIVASRVVEVDHSTHEAKYSETEVVSYHIRPPNFENKVTPDAAWDAYVKQYRDTSDIKTEYLTCMPKLVP
jgi:hypothetical protein